MIILLLMNGSHLCELIHWKPKHLKESEVTWKFCLLSHAMMAHSCLCIISWWCNQQMINRHTRTGHSPYRGKWHVILKFKLEHFILGVAYCMSSHWIGAKTNPIQAYHNIVGLTKLLGSVFFGSSLSIKVQMTMFKYKWVLLFSWSTV